MKLSCYVKSTKSEPVLILLHGFLGSSADWQELVNILQDDFRILTVDLPGHGDSPWSAEYDFDRFCQALKQTIEQQGINSFSLLGYSLGGRLAMAYACAHPDQVEQLILESANPGLVTLEQREQRHRSDLEWHQRFQQQPLTEVLAEWYRQPIFADLTQRQVQHLIRVRMKGDGRSLAEVIMAFSLANQPDYRAELFRLRNTTPIHYIHGAKDHKFAALAQQLLAEQLVDSAHSVLGAGHNVHWQQPATLARLLRAFIAPSKS